MTEAQFVVVRDELKPEVQHQMYGAMNEIDIFLKTVKYYRGKEVDTEIKNLRLVGPVLKEGKFKKMVNNINEGFSNFRLKKWILCFNEIIINKK